MRKKQLTTKKRGREEEEEEEVKRNIAIITKELSYKAEQLAQAIATKEEIRKKLSQTIKELRIKSRQADLTAKELAIIATGKEEIRKKLAVVVAELRNKIKELNLTARHLAIVAKEKEEIKRDKVALMARKLFLNAKQFSLTTKKFYVLNREKENFRKELVFVLDRINRDSKKQYITEEKLKESEIRYRRLFEAAHDGILILNSETGEITDVNPFLQKLLGYTKGEFLGKKLWQVGAFKDIKEAKESFKELQKKGYIKYDDLPLVTKSGKSIDVEFVSNSYVADGLLVIQCNIRDITERKKFELAKESERLLNEEKLKIASIADATHELRTPVAIIKGNIDLAMISNTKNKTPINPVFKVIDNEIKHLSTILSDLTLITSQGNELKNRMVYEKVNLKSLIDRVVARSKILASHKNISIIEKKVQNTTFIGDDIYLEKMLTNLVKNSVIYGKKGGRTEITARKFSESIEIDICDNGMGILKEDLSHIFERFYRAEKSHTSDGSSIGLGLSIVKWVVEAHKGTINVKSTKGKGSTFYVSLPILKRK